MATKIPYCDVTWDPFAGCTKCSPGCLNCWARQLIGGRLKNHPRYKGLVRDGDWTGEVRFFPELLNKPLHWRRPRTIFVCSKCDLFHPKVLISDMGRVLYKMEVADWHKYLVLTKRPEEMAIETQENRYPVHTGYPAPRDHIFWGVSICTQDEIDQKLPRLLQVPGKRWISFEPLLEPIDLLASPWWGGVVQKIDWVVIGCEKLPGKKPGRFCEDEHRFYDDGLFPIIQVCRTWGVPVWVKQLPVDGKVTEDIRKFPPALQIRQRPW